ncbi:MAG: DUF2341 domain-containing protein, partial [Lentisphaerae bacterium]|nr:DUF2341 domain-containing protein [Lentisphaerota bacterium]
MRKTCMVSLSLLILFFLLTVSAFSSEELTSWLKRMPITFSGYTNSETLINFPALIVLEETDAGDGFKYADFLSENHGDLRFSAGDKFTLLDYEVDTWDDASGKSYVWVKIPELASSTVIYVFWGKAGVEVPPCTTNGSVWIQDFTGVWHLNEESGITAFDSLRNIHPGVIMGNTVTIGINGKIGKAYEFSANNGYVRTDIVHNSTVTISAWATSVGSGLLWAREGHKPDLLFASGKIALNWGDGLQNPFCDQPADVNEWHHYVTVLDAAQFKASLYIDGVLASDTATYRNPSGAPPFTISTDWPNDAWTGKIDEFRTANVVRSAAWIWASWKNQGANSDFIAYGIPELQELPDIINYRHGATNVTVNSAWLNGTLVSSGTSGTSVSVFWGTNDGGDYPDNWMCTNTWHAPQSPGEFSHKISGLSEDCLYYYRFMAKNDSGTSWA